jgi:hypothetical protein
LESLKAYFKMPFPRLLGENPCIVCVVVLFLTQRGASDAIDATTGKDLIFIIT